MSFWVCRFGGFFLQWFSVVIVIVLKQYCFGLSAISNSKDFFLGVHGRYLSVNKDLKVYIFITLKIFLVYFSLVCSYALIVRALMISIFIIMKLAECVRFLLSHIFISFWELDVMVIWQQLSGFLVPRLKYWDKPPLYQSESWKVWSYV